MTLACQQADRAKILIGSRWPLTHLHSHCSMIRFQSDFLPNGNFWNLNLITSRSLRIPSHCSFHTRHSIPRSLWYRIPIRYRRRPSLRCRHARWDLTRVQSVSFFFSAALTVCDLFLLCLAGLPPPSNLCSRQYSYAAAWRSLRSLSLQDEKVEPFYWHLVFVQGRTTNASESFSKHKFVHQAYAWLGRLLQMLLHRAVWPGQKSSLTDPSRWKAKLLKVSKRFHI